MKPIEPPQVHENAKRIKYAANASKMRGWQELPAALDDKGLVLTEWEFSAEDLSRVLRGGTLRVWISSGSPQGTIHPMAVETSEPEP